MRITKRCIEFTFIFFRICIEIEEGFPKQIHRYGKVIYLNNKPF